MRRVKIVRVRFEKFLKRKLSRQVGCIRRANVNRVFSVIRRNNPQDLCIFTRLARVKHAEDTYHRRMGRLARFQRVTLFSLFCMWRVCLRRRVRNL